MFADPHEMSGLWTKNQKAAAAALTRSLGAAGENMREHGADRKVIRP
jgi:hypothetical protein